MGIAEILKRNKQLVDSELKRFLPKTVDEKRIRKLFGVTGCDAKAVNGFLTKPVWDFLERGGKRWRPLLMFLSCEAVGGNAKAIARFSVIPELIHNGSLVADDIEDSSLTRRGERTLHLKYGTDVAVNLSSLLYYLPMPIVKNSGIGDYRKAKIYELVNEELLKLHLGQGTDIYWHRAVEPVSEKHYFAMCANKTGTLARLSAKLGAILGGGSAVQVLALGGFAEAIGVAFQIQDDILNLKGGLGKVLGEDIKEGKMSLPVIRTLSVAEKKDKRLLLQILKKHSSDKQEINAAIQVINRYNSLGYSKHVADKMVNKSWSGVEPLLAPSNAKHKLQQLAKFMVERRI